jgi:hypothetical protein
MSKSASGNGTEWLALTGVGIGLIVALIVDRTTMEGTSDRPVVITLITAFVAMLWIAAIRLWMRPKMPMGMTDE